MMKKIVIVMIFIISFYNNSISEKLKNTELYTFDMKHVLDINQFQYEFMGINVKINFSQKYFKIYNMIQYTHDIVGYSTISYGKIYIINDTIYLKDKLFKFIMKAKFNTIEYPQKVKYLIFLKSPIFLKGIKFIFRANYYSSKKSDSDNNYEMNYNFNKDNVSKIYKIHFGTYFYKYGTGECFEIQLNEDQSYEYNYLKLPFSQGHWKQKGNEIILNDETLDKQFKLLVIDDKQLLPIYLPMFWGSNVEKNILKLIE